MGRALFPLAACALLPFSGHAQPSLSLVGSAHLTGHGLRLTDARPQLAGAAWVEQKQNISGGFEARFRFQLTQQAGLGLGADGFAFVIQNEGPKALAGRGSSGGFALGDGGHDWSSPGISRSIAVFFDTFRNADARDPSDNYAVLCTSGPTDRKHWPPPRLAVANHLRFHLKDRKPHSVVIRFEPPLLSLQIDNYPPEFRVPVDLAPIADPAGSAYVGFTASTGNGYQNHDILDWSFTPIHPATTSDVAVVTSEIRFQPDNCLPDRNLCTPREPLVQEKEPNRYSVILPAHIPWGASIPNPRGLTPQISEPRGTVCFDLTGKGVDDCSSPTGIKTAPRDPNAFLDATKPPGALLVETKNGVTRFSVNTRKGKSSSQSQGYYEFEVTLR